MQQLDYAVEERWSALWRPPNRLSLSEWAERNFKLSPEYSAVTGDLRLFGWQRPIFDSFTDPTVTKIVLKVSTQLVKSLFMQVAMAYAIAEAPGPILFVCPKEDDAKTFSKERIATMSRDCSILYGKLAEPKSKDGDNTILYKQFPGGVLTVVGAQSPGNAARRSIQYAFLDEVNKYPISKEGNFVKLAIKRTSTYGSRRKVIEACSPTLPDAEISRSYEDSDQGEPWAECPVCGGRQVLNFFKHVKWPKSDGARLLNDAEKAASAYVECEHCNARWNDAVRWIAAERSEWRFRKPFTGTRGFGGLSHLYSPWHKLNEIVAEFFTAKKNPADYQVFTNTTLAEDWIHKGEAPADELLYERSRRERYQRGTVPAGALFLVAAVDVQKTYLQAEVVGWGRGKENWSIDYRILDGNPLQPEVWAKLTALLNESFPHESGRQIHISRMAVDTGYATNEVYGWARAQGDRVMAVDGRQNGTVAIGYPSLVDVTINGRKIASGLKLWPVATSMLKLELYGWLMLKPPTDEELDAGIPYPPGYCHFPPSYDAEFFRQLTAEHLMTRTVNGRPKQQWEQIRPANHALDIRVYARAAAYSCGVDQAQEEHWRELEAQFATLPPPVLQQAAKPQEQPAQAQSRQQSGWVPSRKWF